MKHLLALALCAGFFTTANSQVYVQGGVNFANISNSKSGTVEDNNMLTTFNAGILGRFGLSSIVDFESGLILSGQGSKADSYFTSSRDDNYVKAKFNPIYLQLPLNFVVKIPLQGDAGIFLHAGPYAAMGIAGNSKIEAKILGMSSSKTEKIKFNNDDPTTDAQEGAAYDRIKRFDFGLNVGGGIDLGKILLKANYGMGFAKIRSTDTNNSANDKNKYRTLSVSVGIPLSR
ncbi:MAG: outer membrane beta-barrel protein [Ginsengibacter sp.]